MFCPENMFYATKRLQAPVCMHASVPEPQIMHVCRQVDLHACAGMINKP